ncbi:sirohydrochlorin ferrochelatase [Sinomonas atrocyanea]|nr:sirohydrochlorin ferrochelatase [Sinomonas atrocyanea]MDR6622094.1 sirohydrochlorin ferrochelatase [Sinomonas atrocyanea]
MTMAEDIPLETQQAQLREVLGTALGLAQEHLEQNGGFLPFGVTLDSEGELRLVMVTPPEAAGDGDYDAEAMMADLLELLRQGRDGCQAVAFASDVHLPEHGSDGIHGAAEHRGGGVMAAVVPYELTAEGYAFGALEADGHEATVF